MKWIEDEKNLGLTNQKRKKEKNGLDDGREENTVPLNNQLQASQSPNWLRSEKWVDLIMIRSQFQLIKRMIKLYDI